MKTFFKLEQTLSFLLVIKHTLFPFSLHAKMPFLFLILQNKKKNHTNIWRDAEKTNEWPAWPKKVDNFVIHTYHISRISGMKSINKEIGKRGQEKPKTNDKKILWQQNFTFIDISINLSFACVRKWKFIGDLNVEWNF